MTNQDRIRSIRDHAVALGDVDGGRALAAALDALSSVGVASFVDALSQPWSEDLYDTLTMKLYREGETR